MRLFIAIELPKEIKVALAACQQELRQTGAHASWPQPDNLHLTLRFLGEVDAGRLPVLKQVCVDTARQATRFTLTTHGLGFFPNTKRPRVVWVGLLADTQQLPTLRQQLEARLTEVGLPVDDKAFHPHLTLGHIKTPTHIHALIERVQAYAFPTLSFTVTELVLMQSQLQATGSLYTPLLRAPLS
jgi:RNA 2',3'-cyclic 3'-phosphodiesterase